MNGTQKEDTGKSMKDVLHVLWYAKGHLSGRTAKKSDFYIALAIVELCLSEDIRQLVRKFC